MYYNKDAYSMYYEKYGNGDKTIVILPGWGETRPTFCHMIQYFSKEYTVYIMDYPGFGNSIFPDRDLTIYDYANMIRDFLEDEGVSYPILIAHSFGGRIATLIAGYYKDSLKKIVLMDAAGIKPKKGIYKRIKQSVYKILKKCVYFFPKRKRNIYLRKLISIFGSSDYKKLDQNMYRSFINIVNEDLKYYYQDIPTETLLIWGSKDKATPLKDAKYMKKHIKNSRLVVYPKTGHFSYLEYAELTNQLIDEFIKDEN